MKLMLCAAIGTAHWIVPILSARSIEAATLFRTGNSPLSARELASGRASDLREWFYATLEARSMLLAFADVTMAWLGRPAPFQLEVQYCSAVIQRLRIGAIMTKGRPESYPPAQSLLEAVWCVWSKYGLPDHSCRFCRTSFPQVEGLWKYAVGHYICGDCRDRALKLSKKP